MKKKTLFLLTIFCQMLCIMPLRATTYTWHGDTDNNWGEAANWDPATGFPNADTDIAVFPFNVDVNLQSAITVSRVIMQNGARLDVDGFPLTFATTKKRSAFSGGNLRIGTSSLNVAEGAYVKLFNPVNQSANILKLVSASGNNDDSVVYFLPQGKSKTGSRQAIFNLTTVGDGGSLKSKVIVGRNATADLSGINVFNNTITVAARGTLLYTTGTTDFNETVTINRGGTLSLEASTQGAVNFNSTNQSINNYGTFQCAYEGLTVDGPIFNKGTFWSVDGANTLSGDITNNGTFQVDNTAGSSLTINGDVTNKRNWVSNGFFTMGGGTTFTNNRKSTVTLSGKLTTTSTVIFQNVDNFGTFNCYNATMLVNASLVNSGTFKVSPQANRYIAGVSSSFADITNSGKMLFYGFNNGNDAGNSISSFNGNFANTGTISFFEDSSNTFDGTDPADALTNSGKGVIKFYDNSFNAFPNAHTHTNTDKANIYFYGNSDNSVIATLVNSGTGKISFYGNSQNRFHPGSTLTNSGAGGINFYDYSYNNFEANSTLNCTGAAGSINFYGYSYTTIKGTLNLTDGQVNIYGDSQVLFNSTSEIHNGAGPTTNPSLNIYGNADVQIENTNAAVYDYQAPTNIYGAATVLVDGAQITGSNITISGNGSLQLSQTGVQLKDVTLSGGYIDLSLNEVQTINENYTQGPKGLLNVTVDNNDASVGPVTKLDVTGNATLGGHLRVEFITSAVDANYTILTAGNTNNTEFDSHEFQFPDGGSASVNYSTPNTVIINRLNAVSLMTLPTNLNKLKGSDRALAKHLVKSAPNLKFNKDAKKVTQKLTQQSQKRFKSSLKQLTPQMNLTAPKTKMQNHRHFAQNVRGALEVQREFQQAFFKDQPVLNRPVELKPKTDFFINSVDLSNQNEKMAHLLGESKDYGAQFGWTHLYHSQFVIENSVSITESNVTTSMGSLSSKNTHLAPSVAFIAPHGYVSLMVLGGASHYQQLRDISFVDLKRTALSNFHSLDLMLTASTGCNLEFSNNISLDAHFSMGLGSQYYSSYVERGAQSLNLIVHDRTMHSGESQFKFALTKSFFKDGVSYKGLLFLDGLCQFAMSPNETKAALSFAHADDSFTIVGSRPHYHELNCGAILSLKQGKNFESVFELKNDLIDIEKRSYELKVNLLF